MTERTYGILRRSAGLILLLAASALLILQVPGVQTRIAAKALDKLLSEMDGKVSIGSANILGFNAFLLRDVTITDDNPMVSSSGLHLKDNPADSLCDWKRCDTLFHAESISASMSIRGLLSGNGMEFGQVDLRNAVMNYIGEVGSVYKDNLSRMFGLLPPEKKRPPGGRIFGINKLNAVNIRYTMRTLGPDTYRGEGIDYTDMDITVSRLRAHNMHFTGGRMYAVCDECRAIEKCGYRLHWMNGRCAVGQGLTEVWDFHYIDDWSEFDIERYTMKYNRAKDFAQYIHLIRMTADLHGRVGVQTINNLSGGSFKGNNMVFNVKDFDAEGYVDDLMVNSFVFAEIRDDGSRGFSGNLSGRVTGIPKVEQMAFDAKLSDGSLESRDIPVFVRNWARTELPPSIADMAKGERLSVDASLKGLLDRAQIGLTLKGERIGAFTADAQVQNLLGGKNMSVKAELSSNNLDIRRIAPNLPISGLDMAAKGKVTLSDKGITLDIDSLAIPHIRAGEYDLRGITALGAYSPEEFVIKLSSLDPSADLRLDASGQTKTDGSKLYNLDAQLNTLNVIRPQKEEDDIRVSANVRGLLSILADGRTDGEVNISDILLGKGADSLRLTPLSAVLAADSKRAAINLISDYITASYNGSSNLEKALADLRSITIDEQMSALLGKNEVKREGIDQYDISVNLSDPYKIVSMLRPELYLSDSTSVRISVDKEGKLNGKILSPRIAMSGSYLKDVDIDLDNYGCINAVIKGSELKAGGIVIKEPALTSFVKDNGFNVQLHYDTMSSIGGYGEFYLDGELYRDKDGELVVRATPLDSYISIEKDIWDFNESEILIKGKDIWVDNFLVSCGDQKLLIDGRISESVTDTLDIYLDDFELSLIDEFTERKLDISGLATGYAHLFSGKDGTNDAVIKMGCESVRIGEHSFGDVGLAGRWEDASKQLKAYLEIFDDERYALSASSSWDMNDKHLDADIYMDRFDIGFVQYLVPNLFSGTSGSLSGELKLKSDEKGLALESSGARINDICLTPAITGVKYSIDGPFSANNKSVLFDSIVLKDNEGGAGVLKGELSYDSVSGPVLDAALSIDNMLVLDSQNSSNPFYGKLRAAGEADLKGPFDALRIDADIRTVGDGDIHIALNNSLNGSTSNLLSFVEPVRELDHYEQMMQANAQRKKKNKSELALKARLNVSSDVLATAEIDKNSGTMASVYGNGDVTLELAPAKGVFNINGDYITSGGNAKVSVAGIVEKMFSIKEGGSVKFSGDPLQSELDLTAVYSLKTSLSSILADSSAVATRRTVDCSINVSDKILNPNISFAINIPDLDPTSKSQVEGALNTEDKIQKQFLSLLLFGSFLPDEYSGVQNNSNVLLSNVGEIMAGQISSILQKLDIPLDLGFGYQQNNGGTDIFDVALSTQLFNNRVLINGSFGNRQYKFNSGGSDMVGDVDVAIKLGKQGNFRLNLFSHSADDYTSYLDYSQRSGAGVSFQREFNNWYEFITGKKKAGKSVEGEEETVSIIIEK